MARKSWQFQHPMHTVETGPLLGESAVRDEQGFYCRVDRKKDMVLSGGEYISPSKIENIMVNIPPSGNWQGLTITIKTNK